mgnify:CR=1 FL=1
MRSDAVTVEEYLDSLPDDRREAISSLRKVFKNLPGSLCGARGGPVSRSGYRWVGSGSGAVQGYPSMPTGA